jgi:hypothetical protein
VENFVALAHSLGQYTITPEKNQVPAAGDLYLFLWSFYAESSCCQDQESFCDILMFQLFNCFIFHLPENFHSQLTYIITYQSECKIFIFDHVSILLTKTTATPFRRLEDNSSLQYFHSTTLYTNSIQFELINLKQNMPLIAVFS